MEDNNEMMVQETEEQLEDNVYYNDENDCEEKNGFKSSDLVGAAVLGAGLALLVEKTWNWVMTRKSKSKKVISTVANEPVSESAEESEPEEKQK